MLQKIFNSTIYLILFLLPLYLIRFQIGWVPFNLLEILICLLFAFWLVFNIKKREVLNYKILIPTSLIFVGVTLSTLFSINLEASAGIWKGWFFVPLLFFVILISVIQNKEQIRNILISLTLSGLGVSLIALCYWLNNSLTYDGRLAAFYLSPNYLAMYLSPILILSLYLYSCFKNKFFKIALFASQILIFIAIYLTYSYGAFLGLLGSLIFILFFQFKFKKRSFSILIIALVAIILIFSQIPSQKFQSFLDFSYPSLKSRIVIWQSAWEILKDNWLIGIGPGMFQKYYLDYQTMFDPYPEWAVPQPHNIFLAFWLQAGLIGLAGFIWLIILFFIRQKQLLVKAASKILPIILMAVVIYILIHGLVDTTYWKNDLAILFWLVMGIGCKAIRFSD